MRVSGLIFYMKWEKEATCSHKWKYKCGIEYFDRCLPKDLPPSLHCLLGSCWISSADTASSSPFHYWIFFFSFSSVQLLSHVWLFVTPWIAARQVSLSITNSRSSLRLTSIESVMPSSHLIFCHPLLLLPLIPPSITVFSNESTLHMKWPKYCSFSFSIIPSKEIPGLISFRMDWLDFLAVQGTLESLLQHHSSKASILRYDFKMRLIP